MVIVPEATQSIRPAEPLVELQVDEFARLRQRMEALDLADCVEDRKEARLLAMNLCDASRELVFRLHRVTRRQLKGLIEEFEAAAGIVANWPLSEFENSERETIRKYGEHIRQRAATLKKHLAPVG